MNGTATALTGVAYSNLTAARLLAGKERNSLLLRAAANSISAEELLLKAECGKQSNEMVKLGATRQIKCGLAESIQVAADFG